MSDLETLKKMKEIFEFGCSPGTWEENVLKFKELYEKLDNSIKNKKVTLKDYVSPDPLTKEGKNANEYDAIEAEHSLSEIINELKADTSARSLMRQSVTVGGQCWWAGVLSSIIENLINNPAEEKRLGGGRRKRRKTKTKRKRRKNCKKIANKTFNKCLKKRGKKRFKKCWKKSTKKYKSCKRKTRRKKK
tara:strand:+ start:776 stop:1345 length:570 start_codon:yes stop_codon:yes gene_type:complete